MILYKLNCSLSWTMLLTRIKSADKNWFSNKQTNTNPPVSVCVLLQMLLDSPWQRSAHLVLCLRAALWRSHVRVTPTLLWDATAGSETTVERWETIADLTWDEPVLVLTLFLFVCFSFILTTAHYTGTERDSGPAGEPGGQWDVSVWSSNLERLSEVQTSVSESQHQQR